MLTLFLFRHGKSDWDANYDTDHERPLAQRGVRAAKVMGNFLAAIDQVPELALTSSARRARETLDLASRQGDWGCPVQIKEELYDTGVDKLLGLLHSFDERPKSLLVSGHEPTCSEAMGKLIGEANVRFPTGAIARIDFTVESWHQVNFGTGELRWFIPPKLLTKSGVKFSN